MEIDIYERRDIEGFEEYAAEINKWSIGLWFDDFEEAGIEKCYIAFDGDDAVGFQTIDADGCCTAIEVKCDYQRKGIAAALIEESGCYRPDRNENPEFWSVIEERYGC